MTKMWRIWNKGSWPEFSEDVLGDTLEEAVLNFDLRMEKNKSIASHAQIIKAELIGDTKD